MKKLLFATAVVLGLAGTAWAGVPLAVKQRAEQQVEATRKALEAMCAPDCGDRMPSDKDWEEEKARLEKIWSSPPLTLEQQMEASRKALEETCAPHCTHLYEPPKEVFDRLQANEAAEMEVKLRKMGMVPDVARKAAWAVQHRPGSDCTWTVRQLLSDYDRKDDKYDGDVIISVEHSSICERKKLH